MIKHKYILRLSISSIVIISALAIGTPAVFAQKPATKAAATQDAVISRLKTRADAEITRRIDALTTLLTKINAMKSLTSAQKTTFTDGIQSQITSLNTLKTKIDADVDIATLRTDVQSIMKGYRIFAVYLPQVNIMAHADRILVVIDEMNAVSTKLQMRIDETNAAGKNTSAMQNLMTDRGAKLTDASTQANNAITTVVSLTPDGFPGNKTTLQSAQKMLQTARQDLVKALQDMQQIRELLRKAGIQTNAKITPEPTKSAD
ncbi:MAG: hypothetical protein NT149_03080 [Candidatus Gottesmanbacteria bacterium]|nr:hypothetical protein [Candidatus Gottesmanbacteria bacterium]